MGVKKSVKKEILKLMLQDVPTEEIARRLHYSIGTVRIVFEELREEYNVNTKVGLASAYLKEEILKVKAQLSDIFEFTEDSCQITTNAKPMPRLDKRQKRKKK